MKIKFPLMVLLGAGIAYASGSIVYQSRVQTASQTAPTLPSDFTSTNSVDLNGLQGFRVTVCAYEDGGFLGASGNLRTYVLDDKTGWVSANPNLDLTVSSSKRCQTFPDQVVGAQGAGRFMYVTDTLLLLDGGNKLVDGGTGAFQVDIRGWKNP